MASISGSQSRGGGGGKMVRLRRTAAARNRTPYTRPVPPHPQPQSPNWLSRFVISPTRFIASGAGKILSTVLDLEASPSSSSSATSSSSSSYADSVAEEVGDLDDVSYNPFEDEVALNQGGTSEHINLFVKELQPLVAYSKSKNTIEQLLMQETFSREEGDRLIKIIRSRVVDSPANDDRVTRPRDISNTTLATGSPELCSAAVMESKKWMLEKKSGLDSNSDLGYGSHSLNLIALPKAPKDEGSPVDVAKSYMRSRPPWSSPSVDHTKPPTLSGVQLFKEETPHLFGGNSTSSLKFKRDSSATESWSIQDEIRRVRSRATEEMLRTVPSSKIDWSALAVEPKNNVNSSAIENIGASSKEKVHNFTNLVDTSVHLAGGLGFEATPDLQSKLDGNQLESVLPDAANIISEQNQGFVAVQKTKGTQDDCREITTSVLLRDGSSDTMHRNGDLVKVNGTDDINESKHQQDLVEETREVSNSRLQDGNLSEFKEKVGTEDAPANGFPYSRPCVYAGKAAEQNSKTLNNELSTVNSNQERIAQGVLEQATRMPRESTEVPDVSIDGTVASKDDGIATGSENSSSVQYGVQQVSSQQGPESGSVATPTSSIAKQKGKRLTRYNKRGSKGVK